MRAISPSPNFRRPARETALNNAFFYVSPLGMMHIAEQNGALVSAAFVDGSEETAPCSPVLSEARAWLDRYFAGRDPGPVPPLAPIGTRFQKAVWETVSGVPFGKTVSYGDLAVSMGLAPRYARAVGGALHRNPLPVFIPCHRAIGKDGSLKGFAFGLARKQALSETERTCR